MSVPVNTIISKSSNSIHIGRAARMIDDRSAAWSSAVLERWIQSRRRVVKMREHGR